MSGDACGKQAQDQHPLMAYTVEQLAALPGGELLDRLAWAALMGAIPPPGTCLPFSASTELALRVLEQYRADGRIRSFRISSPDDASAEPEYLVALVGGGRPEVAGSNLSGVRLAQSFATGSILELEHRSLAVAVCRALCVHARGRLGTT